MSPLEQIIEQLKTLPPRKLDEAAALIRELQQKVRTERLAALARSATLLTDEEGTALERAIEEGCETVDAGER